MIESFLPTSVGKLCEAFLTRCENLKEDLTCGALTFELDFRMIGA